MKYTVNFRDAWKAILIIIIGNFLALVMSLPEDQLPSLLLIKSNLIMSLKFGAIPYIIKNFFTDQVSEAKKIIDEQK